MKGNTKRADHTSANHSFPCSVDFTVDPKDQIHFLYKTIDKQQISYTLQVNTKAVDEKSENYSFACSRNFTRYLEVKNTLTGESYPAHRIKFGHKDIYI